MIEVPSIAVYVRHSADCKYRDDERWKRCNCRKYLRWWDGHRQIKKSAKTRSWERAEEARHEQEQAFRDGKRPTELPLTDRKTLDKARELFLTEKETEGVSDGVQGKYKRELERFVTFAEARGRLFPADIDIELLTLYRKEWEKLYPSSATRQQVQARLKQFLVFMRDAGWLEKLPKLKAIKVDEPPTMPLTEKEYTTLLETVPKQFSDTGKAARVRALIQLMRHSALAIRDAVTLERTELQHDTKKNLYRIATSRQKTGTHVSVPIAPAIAAELLAVLNGNPRFFFWSGEGLETSAVTNWQHDLRSLFRAAFGKDTAFTPHCLRDTAAVEWLTAGIPLEEVSKLLGHTSIRTTEKSYAPWCKGRQERLESLVVATWGNKAQ